MPSSFNLKFKLMAGFAVSASAAALSCPPESDIESTSAIALAAVADPADAPRKTPVAAAVDLAICLDTSGSMDGLIESAKIKLWEIVNDFAMAKPTPKLRVALLTYGNDGHNAENGWVSIDAALTDDLDSISQKLFALRTNGGTELVGRVVRAANEQLNWNASPHALKLIVVAGNESADQDRQFQFRDVCRATIAKGVMVNSIYCGNPADDIAPAWREVATLADGHFAAIDQSSGVIVISTPFDDELAKLSADINTTYIPYGAQAEAASRNQTMQDHNAASVNTAVAAQRCVTKGGSLYWNGSWDLVDACKQADFKLEDVKPEELPQAMRNMTIEQQREHVKQMDARRVQIQSSIADLSVKRQQFVEAEMKKNAEAGSANSFDSAIRKAIREQAASKGFIFEQPKTASKSDEGC
jgi:hypothetical protein